MPLHPDWIDLGLRLACSFLACAVVGLDREWQERAAGLRTTILVGLAACIASISANLLLHTDGRDSSSFAEIDVMRLPLGILTGMGFIGAGAIVRRGDLVHGVTTAATLWFVTVMGLCFGMGQFELGGATFVLGIVTLWVLKRIEAHLHTQNEARLALTLDRDGPTDAVLKDILSQSDIHIRRMSVRYEPDSGRRQYRFRLWSKVNPGFIPPQVEKLRDMPGVEQLEWEM